MFAKNIKISWLDRSLKKKKSKIRKKNSYVFGQIDKSILAKRKLDYQFFLLKCFFH